MQTSGAAVALLYRYLAAENEVEGVVGVRDVVQRSGLDEPLLVQVLAGRFADVGQLHPCRRHHGGDGITGSAQLLL